MEVVRLIHGDPNPTGPGFKSEHVGSSVEGTYKGREQKFHHGSFIVVKNRPAPKGLSSFTLQCWIYPTAPERGASTIVGQWPGKSGGSGYGLSLDADGELTLSVRDIKGKTAELKGGKRLKPFIWYFVAASFDSKSSKATLTQQVVAPCTLSELDSTVHATLSLDGLGASRNASDLMIAAAHGGGRSERSELQREDRWAQTLLKGAHGGRDRGPQTGAPPRAVFTVSGRAMGLFGRRPLDEDQGSLKEPPRRPSREPAGEGSDRSQLVGERARL